jgi:hypothetical protein
MIKSSYIITSRNDHYCGDSVSRLTNTLNFLGEVLNSENSLDTSECILVDWGSKEIALHKILDLNEYAKKITKFIVVPDEIASKYNDDANFSEVHAMNCGFRNMSGKYFLRIDQDTLVGRKFVNWINNTPESELPNLAFSGRRDLNEEESLSFKEIILNENLNKNVELAHSYNAYNNIIDNKIYSFWGSAVGVMMVEKSEFEKLKGFNEELIYMNQMDIEFTNRLLSNNSIYNLGLKLNFDFYHQFHSKDMNKERICNPQLYRNNLFENDNSENWGLKEEDLKIFKF